MWEWVTGLIIGMILGVFATFVGLGIGKAFKCNDAYNVAQMKENYDKFLKKEGIDRDE